MKTVGNIIWFIFGGWMIGLEYFLSGIGMMLTIIGIPLGLQCMKLGILAFWPFGSRVVTNEDTSGCFNIAMNIIWVLIGGVWIALTHVLWGILLCITIIGIPFGKQHFKFIKLALFPFGKVVESVD